jgi:hypothetical protein
VEISSIVTAFVQQENTPVSTSNRGEEASTIRREGPRGPTPGEEYTRRRREGTYPRIPS